ncbi:hypothetical protein HPB51_019545 [Rhipicephalus microplus]|uniref:Tick transposon n=1 Tax=Rhipicephalus microplus TaxID=6941 RepID=A0A9J6F519_RHIMP|nr:hypothetical protein HPB51_019545 [Rhipicephalus microplus]
MCFPSDISTGATLGSFKKHLDTPLITVGPLERLLWVLSPTPRVRPICAYTRPRAPQRGKAERAAACSADPKEAMPHEAMVEGEQISKEEAESNGWITAHRKRNANKTRFKHETHSARQTGAHVGPAKASQLRKVAAASRLPRLPTSHFRVVVRPGGGLDVRTCSQLKVTQAILMAARLPPAAAEEDIVCAKAMQNIFVISTPSESNANAYCKVQKIFLASKKHSISAYITPPGNTCRGVVRGIDTDLAEPALQSLFVTPRNPMVLGVRRIKETPTMIVLFNGMKVPNYVHCGPNMLRCTLYKRHIDTCRNCGRIGYRHDVCPRPTEKVCQKCGTSIIANGHECVQPKCALCGDAHLTGDHTCKNRYQVPYVVRRRRRKRRKGGHKTKNVTSNAGDREIAAPTNTPAAAAPRNAATECSRSSRGGFNSQPTWADKVAGTDGIDPCCQRCGHPRCTLQHMLWQCRDLHGGSGSPSTEEDRLQLITSSAKDQQLRAVQRAREVAESFNLPVPSWARPQDGTP